MDSKVSIILPNYNHAHYLPDSLKAIFSQSVQPLEVIVIDDKSTDNSLALLNEYKKKHSNLKIIKNAVNMGAANAVNIGIEQALGKYLAFCAADDLIEENFIESLESILNSDHSLAICTSDFCTFKNDNKRKISKNTLPKINQKTVIHPKELAKTIQKDLFWIPTNASLYRKEYLQKFIGLNHNLKWMSDWFLNYQIAFHYPIAYIPKPLTAFRLLDNSYSHVAKDKNSVFDSLFDLLKKQPEIFQIFFKKSGILYQQGRKALYYVLAHPTKWGFLLPMVRNTFKYNLKRKFTL